MKLGRAHQILRIAGDKADSGHEQDTLLLQTSFILPLDEVQKEFSDALEDQITSKAFLVKSEERTLRDSLRGLEERLNDSQHSCRVCRQIRRQAIQKVHEDCVGRGHEAELLIPLLQALLGVSHQIFCAAAVLALEAENKVGAGQEAARIELVLKLSPSSILADRKLRS